MGGSITQIVYGEGRRQRAEVRGRKDERAEGKDEKRGDRGQRSEVGRRIVIHSNLSLLSIIPQFPDSPLIKSSC